MSGESAPLQGAPARPRSGPRAVGAAVGAALVLGAAVVSRRGARVAAAPGASLSARYTYDGSGVPGCSALAPFAPVAFVTGCLIPLAANTSFGVTYPGGEKTANGECVGQGVNAVAPAINLEGFAPDAYYTLLMTDPDCLDGCESPNNGSFVYLHWIAANLQGGATGVPDPTNFVIPYKSPAPPAGTHRYTLSLWKQSTGYVDVSDFNGYEYGNGFYERMYFDAQAFVSVNAFLDYPAVAAHYFNAAGPGANCTCPARIP